MLKMSAALAAATRRALAVASVLLVATSAAGAEWNQPWKNEDRALVIDAYEFNPIDWKELSSDERIAGFISKASDGLPPAWSCRGLSGDDERLCKNRWWKYSVTQELYFTRRHVAKSLGLKWGAYHLARPGNPREQADHFIDFAKPEDDELIALDIEDNDPDEWMSLSDAEIFADQIRIRTGRYPVLYTNGSTAEYVSRNKADYPLLSRLPLWYARYRDDITGMFPEETWPSYALWQFSSMHNCGPRSCPYRVKGARSDIDVNVSPLTVAELREAWPFPNLVGDAPVPELHEAEPDALVASLEPESAAGDAATAARTPALAAYGPAEEARRPLDPLALLTEAAREEHRNSQTQPILSAITASAKRVEPDMPGRVPGRASTIATHDLQAGVLGAAGNLQGERDRVRALLRGGAEPAVPMVAAVAAAPAPSTEADARSRIADEMRRAVGEGALNLPSQDAAAADGEETSSLGEPFGERPRASILASRIDEAFVATR